LDERCQIDLKASLLVMRLALVLAEYEGRETRERDFRLAVRLLSKIGAPLPQRAGRGRLDRLGRTRSDMKKRRHHNNKGTRQIRRGKTHNQVAAMAKRLRLPFYPKKK
jgi:hypothetical protein